MADHSVMRFRLDGVDYTLRGDMSQERLREIIGLVEERINGIRAASPHYSAVRASTLAALQLAEALLDARDENAELLAEANIGASYSAHPPLK